MSNGEMVGHPAGPRSVYLRNIKAGPGVSGFMDAPEPPDSECNPDVLVCSILS